jgi:hypothetical protein
MVVDSLAYADGGPDKEDDGMRAEEARPEEEGKEVGE